MNNWLLAHGLTILFGGGAMLLALHFHQHSPKFPFNILIGSVAVCGAMAFLVLFTREDEHSDVVHVIAVLYLYSIALYIILCDILLGGVARYLTRKRGEKWVKELDYIYLTIGAIGILWSINKIDILGGRLSRADVLAPMVLATAVVIRFIKTRADIGGWNKL